LKEIDRSRFANDARDLKADRRKIGEKDLVVTVESDKENGHHSQDTDSNGFKNPLTSKIRNDYQSSLQKAKRSLIEINSKQTFNKRTNKQRCCDVDINTLIVIVQFSNFVPNAIFILALLF